MVHIDSAIKILLSSLGSLPPLCPELARIGDEAFVLEDECYVLVALQRKAKNVTRSSFYDRTGYGCFVNSLHIEDYDAKAPLAQAVQFILYVFCKWRSCVRTEPLVAVVNVDEPGVIVKFHAERSSEQWLSDNVEAYSPTMSVESSEDLTAFPHSLR